MDTHNILLWKHIRNFADELASANRTVCKLFPEYQHDPHPVNLLLWYPTPTIAHLDAEKAQLVIKLYAHIQQRFLQIASLWENTFHGDREELLSLLKNFYDIHLDGHITHGASNVFFTRKRDVPQPLHVLRKYHLSLPTHLLPFDEFVLQLHRNFGPKRFCYKNPDDWKTMWLFPLHRENPTLFTVADVLDYNAFFREHVSLDEFSHDLLRMPKTLSNTQRKNKKTPPIVAQGLDLLRWSSKGDEYMFCPTFFSDQPSPLFAEDPLAIKEDATCCLLVAWKQHVSHLIPVRFLEKTCLHVAIPLDCFDPNQIDTLPEDALFWHLQLDEIFVAPHRAQKELPAALPKMPILMNHFEHDFCRPIASHKTTLLCKSNDSVSGWQRPPYAQQNPKIQNLLDTFFFLVDENSVCFTCPDTTPLHLKAFLQHWHQYNLMPLFLASDEANPEPRWHTLLWKATQAEPAWSQKIRDVKNGLYIGQLDAPYRVGMQLTPNRYNQAMACAGPFGAVKSYPEDPFLLALAVPLDVLKPHAQLCGVFYHPAPSVVIAAYETTVLYEDKTKKKNILEVLLNHKEGLDPLKWIENPSDLLKPPTYPTCV